MSESSHPLQWPVTWPRTDRANRRSARFEGRYGTTAWTIERARRELSAELERLGALDPILSTNLRLRLDGAPASNQAQPADPGAAVYFTLNGRRTVLACDRWLRVEHNIRAIALHVSALRGMDRWGVGSIEQAFTGYAALPERASAPSWMDVLGFEAGQAVTAELASQRFRQLAKVHHPDVPGGSAEAFKRLKQAHDEALCAFGVPQ